MSRKREIKPKEIVDHAIGVLAEVGFARFSGVKVAQSFGIRQSHLTYYFPTRHDLLAAMSERLTERYAQLVEDWCREAMRQSEDPLAYLIDRLVVDAVTPPTAVLFPALWEAANEDPSMATALDRIYRSAQARLILMLGVDPEAPEAEPLWRLINVLGVIIEGATAVYGRRDATEPELIRLRETVKRLLLPAFQEALKRNPTP